MRRRIVATCGFVLSAVVLGVAAQRPSPELLVTLRFLPQESVRSSTVALPPSMLDRSVDIRVQDARDASDPRAIGTGTNDDDLPFPIRATSDVGAFAGESITDMANAQALKRTGPADRVLQLRLTRFHVNESNKAVGSTYTADVHLAYTLLDAQGKTLAEGAAAGTATRYGRARSGGNCAEVLSDALKDAYTKVFGDATLQQAWSTGQASLPVTAVGAPPSAPGAPSGSIESRLQAVDDLFKRGVITKEEHAARRAAILKEI
jgi:hypothetical protein